MPEIAIDLYKRNSLGSEEFLFSVSGPLNSALNQLTVSPNLPPISALIAQPAILNGTNGLVSTVGGQIEADLNSDANWAPTLASTLNDLQNLRALRLRFRNNSDALQAIPWEAIHNPAHQFLTVHKSLCVEREIKQISVSGPRERLVAGRLKISVILAAAGTNSQEEWQVLSAAVNGWGQSVDLLVIVDSLKMEKTVKTTAFNGNISIQTALVATEYAIRKSLADFQPHILHVFCHGSLANSQYIELSTPASVLGGPPVVMTPFMFAEIKSLWVLVLNACAAGGAVGNGSTSFAADTVKNGVPFVAAMREMVDSTTVSHFTAGFYRGLFSSLQALFTTSTTISLDCRSAMIAGRQSIIGQGPGVAGLDANKSWTFPVLYCGEFDLKIKLRIDTNSDPENFAALVAERRDLVAAIESNAFQGIMQTMIQARVNEINIALERA
jgi:CHAT domain